jgi:hypothetical protein
MNILVLPKKKNENGQTSNNTSNNGTCVTTARTRGIFSGGSGAGYQGPGSKNGGHSDLGGVNDAIGSYTDKDSRMDVSKNTKIFLTTVNQARKEERDGYGSG